MIYNQTVTWTAFAILAMFLLLDAPINLKGLAPIINVKKNRNLVFCRFFFVFNKAVGLLLCPAKHMPEPVEFPKPLGQEEGSKLHKMEELTWFVLHDK